MSIFNDSDLDGFSDLFVELAARDTATIERYTRVPDDQGGADTPTWSTVATVPCMVTEVTLRIYEETLAQRPTQIVQKQVSLPRLTDVRLADNITIASQGLTYEVIRLETGKISYEVVRRVIVGRESI